MSKLILTVDDSATVRSMLSFTLRCAGFDVIEAEDGLDGLQKASDQRVDLVLTDQDMPGMDGLTLIKSLRRMPTYRKSPIFVLTSDSDESMKERGREAGATGWIVKPFDPERLLKVVREMLA